MLKFFKISGDSLYPSYKDGERVLCRKVYTGTSLFHNDTVVFKKEPYGLIVKKITFINVDKYYVRGTLADSMDSRSFGYINREDILYKILFKF